MVENILVGDELRTDTEEIEKKITDLGSEAILCVMTTTSCFAPRGFDEYAPRLCQSQYYQTVLCYPIVSQRLLSYVPNTMFLILSIMLMAYSHPSATTCWKRYTPHASSANKHSHLYFPA